MSRTNPQNAEDIFKFILGHLDISDEFYQQYLKSNRCRSIRTALLKNEDHWQRIKLQIETSTDEEAVHAFIDLRQFIKAVKFHMETDQGNIDWTNITQDGIYDMMEAYEDQRKGRVEFTSTPASKTAAPEETTIISTNSGFAKRSLTSFSCSKMPSVPISNKQMTDFKINFENDLRSMDLEYIIEKGYNKPDEADNGYKKFMNDNKFVYSALVNITKDHEARHWLLNPDVKNDGRLAWKKLLENYDSETIEDSLTAVTLKRFVNLKLDKNFKGACNTYITSFAACLAVFKEENVALPERLARDMFLLNITHDDYKTTVTDCKVRKLDLNECYEAIKTVGVTLEKGAEKANRQIRRAKTTSDGKGGSTNGPLKYMGKEVNEYGFFIDSKFYNNLKKEDKDKYWTKRNEWIEKGHCKRKPRGNKGGINKKETKFVKSLFKALDASS